MGTPLNEGGRSWPGFEGHILLATPMFMGGWGGYFFVKPDRKYLESLHLTDFLGIKHVPGEVSISLAINFKGNRIIEMTEQVFDFHFSNLLPFSHRLAQLMLCI